MVLSVVVRGYQITLAIAVEVVHSHRTRPASGAEGVLGLKRPIAVAEQHARGGAVPVCDNQVALAVAVEVAHGY